MMIKNNNQTISFLSEKLYNFHFKTINYFSNFNVSFSNCQGSPGHSRKGHGSQSPTTSVAGFPIADLTHVGVFTEPLKH